MAPSAPPATRTMPAIRIADRAGGPPTGPARKKGRGGGGGGGGGGRGRGGAGAAAHASQQSPAGSDPVGDASPVSTGSLRRDGSRPDRGVGAGAGTPKGRRGGPA